MVADALTPVVEIALVPDDGLDGEPEVLLSLDLDDLEAIAGYGGAADVLRDAADGTVQWEQAHIVAALLRDLAAQVTGSTASRLGAAADALAAAGDDFVVAGPVVHPQALELDTVYTPAELAALFHLFGEDEHAEALLESFDDGTPADDRVTAGLAALLARGIIAEDGVDEDAGATVAQPHAELVAALTSPAIALSLAGVASEGGVRIDGRVTDEWAVFTEVVEAGGETGLVMSMVDPGDAIAALLDAAGAFEPRPAAAAGSLTFPLREDGTRLRPDLSALDLDIDAAWSVECRWVSDDRVFGDTVDWLDAGDAGLFLTEASTARREAKLTSAGADDIANAILAMLPS